MCENQGFWCWCTRDQNFSNPHRCATCQNGHIGLDEEGHCDYWMNKEQFNSERPDLHYDEIGEDGEIYIAGDD